MPCKLPTILVLICLACSGIGRAVADSGHPIAIRRWSDTAFTIETMENMHVGIGLKESDADRLPRKPDLSVEVVKENDPVLMHWSAETSQPLTLAANKFGAAHIPSAILVSRYKVLANELTVVFVDGIAVVCFNGLLPNEIDDALKKSRTAQLRESSLVVIATSSLLDVTALGKISDALSPQVMIVDSKFEKIDKSTVEAVPHNTIAVSASAKTDNQDKTRIVSLGDQPWAMTDEVAVLFAKKEAACKSSREMFSKLSVEQMNFKPSDGSHTPRWNAEHMMGRELLFFSQIFHAVDPMIPVIDLNPRQMPKDYTFAHSDWSGAEEAAQMMRVEAFTRRFAYMLDGMDLDKKSAGSKFWSPRGLLKQMERHYNQHSANVVKKMDLEDWPGK